MYSGTYREPEFQYGIKRASTSAREQVAPGICGTLLYPYKASKMFYKKGRRFQSLQDNVGPVTTAQLRTVYGQGPPST